MNITLYIHKEDRDLVDRARRLLQFHEGTSLSQEFVAICGRVVRKYEDQGAGTHQRAGQEGTGIPATLD